MVNTSSLLVTCGSLLFTRNVALVIANENQKTYTAYSSSSRKLALKCPLVENPYGNNEDYVSAGHSLDTYSKGNVGRGLIKKMRGKKLQSYYQDIVESIVMSLCDVENEKERCVSKNSSLAAKDWNSTCLVASDQVCPENMCERRSNCYWSKVINGKKRTTRYPAKSYGKARNSLLSFKERSSYIRDVSELSIIGMSIGLGLGLLWFLFFVGRYCCCCLRSSSACNLCSPIPSEEGYHIRCQWNLPSSLYALSFAGIIASGILSLIGNEDMNVASTNSFELISSLVGDIGSFLGDVKLPLISIQDIVQDAAIDAQTIFNNTGYVKVTAANIISAFATFGTLHLQGLESLNAASDFDSALAAFNNEFSPIVNDIQGIFDTLEGDLYGNVDTIQSGLGSAIGQIDSFREETVLWQDMIHNYESKEHNLRTVRKMSVLGVFLVSFVLALIGFIGILLSRKEMCLVSCTGILSAVLGSVVLILASVTLCVAFLWNDACEINSLVIADLEPFVGETIAWGVNGIINDTSIAVVFNVTDKINFATKLDNGLSNVKDVNITEQLSKVVNPLGGIQVMVDSITTTAIKGFNIKTTVNLPMCPFDERYTVDTVLKPWEANVKKYTTPWILKSSGEAGIYSRLGKESPKEYISRIYDTAGVCLESNSCCLNANCSQPITYPCNSGNDCDYPCSKVSELIKIGYDAVLEAFETEQKLTADLGVKCPLPIVDYTVPTCPTTEFREMDQNRTLVGLINAYGENITKTSHSLVNITTTSVGGAMDEVHNFVCSMDTSLYVGSRYYNVREEVCGTMLGGFAQVNWALWVLGISLEIIAILANLLSKRLRGMSKKEAWEKMSDTSSSYGLISTAKI